MLIPAPRQGFTLIELMLSTAMMLIVGGSVYRLLHTTQRLSRVQAGQISLQSSLRSGALVVSSELRELSSGDLVSIGSSGLIYRAMRGFGFLCQPATSTQLRISRADFSGYRDPQPGRDSIYLFMDEGEAQDAGWEPLSILQVSTAAPCPGGAAGIALTVGASVSVADAPSGTPVRTYESMELKLYRSEGKSWLGLRSVSAGEAIQPVIGPLNPGDGFGLEYLTGDDRATTDLTAVRSIRYSLRATSEAPGGSGGGSGMPIHDALTSQVALRNAPRP